MREGKERVDDILFNVVLFILSSRHPFDIVHNLYLLSCSYWKSMYKCFFFLGSLNG